MSFVIDTGGQLDDVPKPLTIPSFTKFEDKSDEEWNVSEIEPPSFVNKIISLVKNLNSSELNEKPAIKPPANVTKTTVHMEKICDDLGWNNRQRKRNQSIDRINDDLSKNNKTEEVLKKSIITPRFEKLHSVLEYNKSDKRLKEERKREREKTKGHKWYGLPATEVTEEVKHDLEVLQMRSVLDPKHFYKKNDLKVLPKYFQIGKVIDSPLDYYNDRCTKKERKHTLVEELLADAEFNKYNKRRYEQIIKEKEKTHYKAYKQAKKLKRKSKK